MNEFEGDEEKYEPSEPPELPIAPMIDIFAMIVIFLVLGSVFGSTDIKVPNNLFLPKSKNDEMIVVAPQVALAGTELRFDFLNHVASRSVLSDVDSLEYQDLVQKIKKYQAGVSPEIKTGQNPVNLIADAETPYSDVYLAVSLLRNAGFENVLFISNFE